MGERGGGREKQTDRQTDKQKVVVASFPKSEVGRIVL